MNIQTTEQIRASWKDLESASKKWVDLRELKLYIYKHPSNRVNGDYHEVISDIIYALEELK